MDYNDTSSFSSSYSSSPWLPEESEPLTPAIALVVVNVVGLVGNVSMIYVNLANRHMRTVPNVLILNLAVADLLYILVPTPFYIKKMLSPDWDLPEFVCKLKGYLSFVAMYASVYALAALSWDRHAAVTSISPARQRKTSRLRNLAVVLLLWLAAFLLAIPNVIFAFVRHIPALNQADCRIAPIHETTRQANAISRFGVGYVLPLMMVAFYYLRIAVHICRSTQRFSNTSDSLARQTRDRRRLAVLVLVITLFFAVCWLPYFSYFLVIHFGVASLAYRDAAYIMPVVNTCLDPWLLFAISSKHRECLVRCLGRARHSASTQGTADTNPVARTRTSAENCMTSA